MDEVRKKKSRSGVKTRSKDAQVLMASAKFAVNTANAVPKMPERRSATEPFEKTSLFSDYFIWQIIQLFQYVMSITSSSILGKFFAFVKHFFTPGNIFLANAKKA